MLEIWEGELPEHISHQLWLSADVLSITARQWKSLLTSFLMLVVDVDHPHGQVDNIIKLPLCSMLWGSTIADVLNANLCGSTYFFVIPVERIWVRCCMFSLESLCPYNSKFQIIGMVYNLVFLDSEKKQCLNFEYFHIHLAFKFMPNSPV
jgi:hypothetical protein